MRTGPSLVVGIGFLLITATGALAQPSPTLQPVVPIDPITAIIYACRSHDVVAMSDAHGNEQNHAFRLALIRDPRFVETVNDIVVEGGNARYQDLSDRYVRGEDVPYSALRQIWQNTTVPTAGNNYSMMEDLLEAVRAVNASRPGERQLRVLLGDPPIDWSSVRTHDDYDKWFRFR